VQRLPVTLCRVDGSAAIVRSTVAGFFSGAFFVGLVRSVRGRRFAERNSAGPRMCYLGSDPESGTICARMLSVLNQVGSGLLLRRNLRPWESNVTSIQDYASVLMC
jgi:hypothetical protein